MLYPFAEGHRQHLSARHWRLVVSGVLRKSLADAAAGEKPNGSCDDCRSLRWPTESFQSKSLTR